MSKPTHVPRLATYRTWRFSTLTASSYCTSREYRNQANTTDQFLKVSLVHPDSEKKRKQRSMAKIQKKSEEKESVGININGGD
jgi:hypothetical protein